MAAFSWGSSLGLFSISCHSISLYYTPFTILLQRMRAHKTHGRTHCATSTNGVIGHGQPHLALVSTSLPTTCTAGLFPYVGANFGMYQYYVLQGNAQSLQQGRGWLGPMTGSRLKCPSCKQRQTCTHFFHFIVHCALCICLLFLLQTMHTRADT